MIGSVVLIGGHPVLARLRVHLTGRYADRNDLIDALSMADKGDLDWISNVDE
jgi:hypothetical protein